MTAVKPGDRVRVVIEGTASYIEYLGGPYFEIRAGNGTGQLLGSAWHDRDGVSVEVLPPPEPEWQAGDVVIDKHGIAHLRVEWGPRPGDVWQTFNGEFHDDTFPFRPLTLVVRDRTLVAP